MASRMELVVNGRSYLDFKSARVNYSIESLARTFTFDYTDKWLITRTQQFPFTVGDAVDVRVYGAPVLSGYLERIHVRYSGSSRTISLEGRSKACDLVDCSAVYAKGSWRNATLLDIGKALLDPYGLTITVDPWAAAQAVAPFKRWAIEDEETVHGCLARAARMRGLFLVSDESSNVHITKTAPLIYPYPLVYGQNIYSATYDEDATERFSDYTVKSQHAGDDTFFAESVGKNFYKTKDVQVSRHRPLIVVSDGLGRPNELMTRGDWERNYRAGKSRRLSYTHVGFNTFAGLFPINRLVSVNDPIIDFTGNLLIASVSYDLADEETTTLELAAPETFDVLIPPAKRRPTRGPGLSI